MASGLSASFLPSCSLPWLYRVADMGSMRQGTRRVPWLVHPAVQHLCSLTLGCPRPQIPVLYSILQCCSSSWARLTGTALLPLCPPCRAEELRGIQVGLYQLWASQLGAALCRCLPGPCCESSESCSTSSHFPLETVLTASLACLIVLRLYLGCCRVLGYRKGHWGGGPDSLCVTLFSYSYDWWVINLILFWNILAPVERATVALLWNFSTVGEFLYSWWHFSTYASKYSTNTLSPFILPAVTTQMCSFKCPDLSVPLGRDHLYAADLQPGTMTRFSCLSACHDCKGLLSFVISLLISVGKHPWRTGPSHAQGKEAFEDTLSCTGPCPEEF